MSFHKIPTVASSITLFIKIHKTLTSKTLNDSEQLLYLEVDIYECVCNVDQVKYRGDYTPINLLRSGSLAGLESAAGRNPQNPTSSID